MPATPMAVAKCVFPLPGPPMNTTFCAVSTNSSVASLPIWLSSICAADSQAKSNPARSRWIGNRATFIWWLIERIARSVCSACSKCSISHLEAAICDSPWASRSVQALTMPSRRSSLRGIGFANAIGRPKNGPEKAPGRARRGPKYASLGGFSAQSGRLQARGWRAGGSLNVHGAQDWTRVSGLTLMLAMACRRGAQRHHGCGVAAARGDRCPTAQAAQAAKCSPASRALPLGGG